MRQLPVTKELSQTNLAEIQKTVVYGTACILREEYYNNTIIIHHQ